VFKDIISKEILICKHINSELVIDYKQQLKVFLDLGYKVQAIIIDGKRGLYKAFKDYPIQMCHFHQRKTINKYLTRKPDYKPVKIYKKLCII
jgi:carbonic anhydrase